MIQIEFIGNVGADAEIRSNAQGKDFVTFRVAVSKRWKDEQGRSVERTKWISCSRTGTKTFADCLKQGKKVYIRGDVDARSYENGKGETITELVCHVWDLEFLGDGKRKEDAPF